MSIFRYKSLIGTIGKKFATKRKRSEVADSTDDDESEPDEPKKPSPSVTKPQESRTFDRANKGKKAYRFMKPN